MNKSIKNILATVILAVLFSAFFPWWSIMIAALVTGYIFPLKRAAVFFIPFLAILLYWGAYSLVLSSTNNFILAKKIAVLLPLGGNAYLLIFVTGIIGGIAAGTSAVLGKQIRSFTNT